MTNRVGRSTASEKHIAIIQTQARSRSPYIDRGKAAQGANFGSRLQLILGYRSLIVGYFGESNLESNTNGLGLSCPRENPVSKSFAETAA